MIFRHLFKCKYIERKLCSIWSKKNEIPVNALLSKFLNFIRQTINFMCFEVIEPLFSQMEAFLRKVLLINFRLTQLIRFLEYIRISWIHV